MTDEQRQRMLKTIDDFELVGCEIDLCKVPKGILVPSYARELQRGSTLAVVSWLSAETIAREGLPSGAICGFLRDPGRLIDHENFVPSREFVELVQTICKDSLDPGLNAYAASSAERRVVVIDQRSVDVNGEIPKEDIIGCYDIEDGAIRGYTANPEFRLVTTSGAFRLTPWLRQQLARRVLA